MRDMKAAKLQKNYTKSALTVCLSSKIIWAAALAFLVGPAVLVGPVGPVGPAPSAFASIGLDLLLCPKKIIVKYTIT